MIIDCHGHYTTAPAALERWRTEQLRAWQDGAPLPDPDALRLDDDTLRASVEGSQLRLQRERGIDLTLFSPRASAMAARVLSSVLPVITMLCTPAATASATTVSRS
jgi:4-oxalmesaconate hydratase